MSNSMDNIYNILGIEEIKDYRKLWRQLAAEFIGTFLYLSIQLLITTEWGTSFDVTRIALSNGLLIASVVQIIGHVSGGHVNPAVTVGALILGYIKPIRALLYVIAQILGSIAGALVTFFIATKETRLDFGMKYSSNLTIDKVFAVEFLITFVLVSVVLSVVDPYRGLTGLGSAALAIGLSITACQVACLGYSGFMNPVRAFGPALVMGIWDYHWVYWVGPLSGALIAGLVYRYIFIITTSTTLNDN